MEQEQSSTKPTTNENMMGWPNCFGINYQYFKAEVKDNFLLLKNTARK